LDGLAAGVSGIASFSLFAVAYLMVPDIPIVFAVLYAALAGAIMGFLPYNYNPAKIFIGSTGAYFIGFVLAVISIEGATKAYTALTMIVSLIALGLPIFDTLFAILRRVLNRKPIGEGDRGHIHHRLIDKGISQKYSVTILYVVSGALGLISILLANKGLLPAIVLVVIISLFGIGGWRYLAGIVGDKRENVGDENGTAKSDGNEKENNIEKTTVYPPGQTEKL
jgi:UDP-GlcNAc:undecaprenyl-phosphate GlcNAc-1-phosphate transferase